MSVARRGTTVAFAPGASPIHPTLSHRLSLRLQHDERDILPLIGPSRTMRELARQIELLAQSERAVALLIGEDGTGKGQLAEYIHARSSRASRPFMELNCAAINRTDLIAELFGSGVPGSPPGALSVVDGGTIFIGEVCELPQDVQARLLKFMEGGFDSTGSPHHTSVRVIAASSRDLVNEVNAGRFREDLYYRLGVMPVHLPPLRARTREDLTELMTATFTALSMNVSSPPRTLGADVTDTLIAYPWPGNIRELRNALERAIFAARGSSVLERHHIPPEFREDGGSESGGAHAPRTLADVERAHIHRTLRANKLNRTHAAIELGISRATLIKKIKEYGLVYRPPEPS